MSRSMLLMAVVLMLAIVTPLTAEGSAEEAEADFPTEEITMYVGFSAGGGTDLVAREIARGMEEYLEEPVVVENQAGAGGLVAVKEMISKGADGYTIATIATMNQFIQKYLDESESWIDPLDDLEPLGFVNADYWAIAVEADAPYDTVPEFIEYLEENPGRKVTDAGIGTTYHWGWEKFISETGVDVDTVAYDGTADALRGLAGGEVTGSATSLPEAESLVDSGEIKILAVAAPERLDQFPDTPTFDEQGLDFEYNTNRSIVAPAGVPDAIAEKLAEAVEYAYSREEYQEFLETTGYGGMHFDRAESKDYYEELDEMLKGLMDEAGTLKEEFAD